MDDIVELTNEDFWLKIRDGNYSYIDIEDTLYPALSMTGMEHSVSHEIYMSRKIIKTYTFVGAVSNKFREAHRLYDSLNLLLAVYFETKPIEMLFMKAKYVINALLWEEPPVTLSSMTLKECRGAFKVWLNGLLLASATTFAEILFKHFIQYYF